jgi:hypothetical protein
MKVVLTIIISLLAFTSASNFTDVFKEYEKDIWAFITIAFILMGIIIWI